MIIDTSALLAILFGEPEAPAFIGSIGSAASRWVAAPTLVETAAVVRSRLGPAGEVALDALIQRLDLEVVPFTADAATLARTGYSRFGKGVGSPAVLNFGDGLTYGAAMALGEPLLFKGDDFTQTDVEPALR